MVTRETKEEMGITIDHSKIQPLATHKNHKTFYVKLSSIPRFGKATHDSEYKSLDPKVLIIQKLGLIQITLKKSLVWTQAPTILRFIT